MITYLFPLLDILTASVLMLHTQFGFFNTTVVVVHGFYLGTKGMLFAHGDFASKVDVLCALYIIIAAIGLFSSSAVTWIVFIWLMQKAVFALVPLR